MKTIEGGVTAAKGFEAACCEAGIKYKDRTDMALVFSTKPCVSASIGPTKIATQVNRIKIRIFIIRCLPCSQSC